MGMFYRRVVEYTRSDCTWHWS